MSIATYTPGNITLTIAGHVVEGWDSITVKRNSASFRHIPGIRGSNTRVRIKDSSATLTVEVAQTSNTNTIFSQIHQLDISQGTGRLELMLRDPDGDYVFQSNTGYIEGYPESGFSGDIQTRTWTINCQASSLFVGGNAEQGFDLLGAAKNALSELI